MMSGNNFLEHGRPQLCGSVSSAHVRKSRCYLLNVLARSGTLLNNNNKKILLFHAILYFYFQLLSYCILFKSHDLFDSQDKQNVDDFNMMHLMTELP